MNKLLATIKSTSPTKDGPGSFEAVLSMPTIDRDNEVIDARAFEPLPDHITIDIDHAMTVEKTVGSGRPYYDGDTLKFEGTYASTPLAQMVRTLVDEGHIRTMSVAFMPGGIWQVDDADGKNHLRKGELLNAGIVGIPSNRDALITASKSLVTEVIDATMGADTKSGARNSTHDLSLLQAAHDALTALGAACEAKAASTDAEPTDTTEKAAEAADVKSPAEPAGPSVEVDHRASTRALLADVALGL